MDALEQRTMLSASSAGQSIVSQLATTHMQAVSTVPANGDQNPYGVAFVPQGFPSGGPLQPGDILVSNFNNSANLQGTGTTIVREAPNGHTSVFFQRSGLGLTTALGVLQRGFVIVGSVPTSDGSTVQPPGSLLILDRQGKLVMTLSDSKLLDGPWDLTVHDEGAEAQVFVSNVLNGTVTRLDLSVPAEGDDVDVISKTRIASGYAFRADPAALVVGPTGLAFDDSKDLLYVASTGDNAIFSIPSAQETHRDHGTGNSVFSDANHLRGPLGLVLAPNGDLVTTNGDAVNPDPNNVQNSEIVEFTTSGNFVGQFSLNSSSGAAFGIAVEPADANGHFRFAAVNDATNQLDVWKLQE
jgi:hypothetical protein